jgi:hypothetical protein
MSPQEKRHGVMARIRTSDLTIERRTLYHLSYPARLWDFLLETLHSIVNNFSFDWHMLLAKQVEKVIFLV